MDRLKANQGEWPAERLRGLAYAIQGWKNDFLALQKALPTSASTLTPSEHPSAVCQKPLSMPVFEFEEAFPKRVFSILRLLATGNYLSKADRAFIEFYVRCLRDLDDESRLKIQIAIMPIPLLSWASRVVMEVAARRASEHSFGIQSHFDNLRVCSSCRRF